MISKYKKLNIPKEEKLYILPASRKKLFKDLLNEYKKRFPNFNLIYANLNHNSSIPIDYILIFTTKISNNEVILIETPYLYSDRAIPGYRYCKRENQSDLFFEEASELMTRMPYDRFVEYLNAMLELSVDENSDNYWKAPENMQKFTEGVLTLGSRFRRRE